MNKLRAALGDNVRRARSARGITQSQLAEAIGRSTDLVSRIERGESAPSFGTLEKLCEILETPPAALFGGIAGASPVAPEREALERLTQGMTLEEIAWLADLVRVARASPRRR